MDQLTAKQHRDSPAGGRTGSTNHAAAIASLEVAERRARTRRTIDAPAFLILDRRGQVLPCLMRNTSDTGALLELKASAWQGGEFPFSRGDRSVLFILEVERSQVVDIEIARLDVPSIGVRFVGPFSTFEAGSSSKGL